MSETVELREVDEGQPLWAHGSISDFIGHLKEKGEIPEDAHVDKMEVEVGEPVKLTYSMPPEVGK